MRKKKKPNNDDHGQTAADDDESIVTIKCLLKTVLRDQYRQIVINDIEDKSLNATKFCLLGSLMFLYQCQDAFENGDVDFFNGDGERIIRSCFNSVLDQNIQTSIQSEWAPDFYEMAAGLEQDNQFTWPTNNYSGNVTGDLIDQYVTNVKTNLNTHSKKRLSEYLKVYVYNHNSDPQAAFQFDQDDIRHTVNWAIYTRDSIGDATGDDDERKRERRDALFERLNTELSWWQIENYDIARFTRYHWLKSLPLWLNMQRQIDHFNTTAELRRERQRERQQNRRRERRRRYRQQRRLRQQQQQQQQPESQPQAETQPQNPHRRKSQLKPKEKPKNNANQPPKVKNLTIIPICSFKRKHVAIDNRVLFKMFRNPRDDGEGKKKRNKGVKSINFKDEFMPNKELYWDTVFNLPKIRRLGKSKKQFRFRVLSDGVSVSLQFNVKKSEFKAIDLERIKKQYLDGFFKYVLGIDPGLKTWNATVRRTVATGKEVNMTTSSKRYHWDAQQKTRNSKAKRWTKAFKAEEQRDLNDRHLYPATPSPLGQYWLYYIRHKMKMLKRGMDVYATAKYARLSADKHIWSQRAIDRIAVKLVNKGPALIFMGNVDVSPNCPIRIKKHVRCPGNRKLLNAFKKLGNCVIIPVDEYFTSQTCAKCFGRFNPTTRSKRFKVCLDCQPSPTAMLPSLIVAKTGKREMKELLDVHRQDQRMGIIDQGVKLSKMALHHKTWMVNPVTGILEYASYVEDELNVGSDEIEENVHIRKTVWHRDIVAAKCILIKGYCTLFGLEIPQTLQRPQNQPGNDVNNP